MEPRFHVVLEGRRMGPYDRRTIVGMRVRKTLTSDHVLIGTDGEHLTVRELLGRGGARPRVPAVVATYPATLVSANPPTLVPPFRGAIEIRLQAGALRMAGRYQRGKSWHEARAKLSIEDIVYAGSAGTDVELGVRAADASVQRLRLDLGSPAAAVALLGDLPGAAPWPVPVADREDRRAVIPGIWAAAAGALIGGILAAAVLMAQQPH